MNIKELAEAQFSASNFPKTPEAKQIFLIAFEMGLHYGNTIPQMSIKPVYLFKLEVSDNTQLKDIICMQQRIPEHQYWRLLETFFDEQTALQRTYKDIAEVNNHFRNWVKKQAEFMKSNQPNNINKL